MFAINSTARNIMIQIYWRTTYIFFRCWYLLSTLWYLFLFQQQRGCKLTTKSSSENKQFEDTYDTYFNIVLTYVRTLALYH